MEHIEVILQLNNLDKELTFEIIEKNESTSFPQSKNLFNYFIKIMQAIHRRELFEMKFKQLSKKTIRQLSNWKNAQLKIQVYHLKDKKYLFLHKGKVRESFVYEVLFDKIFITVCKLQGINQQ